MCLLEKKLEKDNLDYALGAAMMEPDFRENSNEKGFCTHHFGMLFDIPNKLPLALVLDTHLEETRKKMSKLSKSAEALGKSKGGLFRKNGAADFAASVCELLSGVENSCIICDKINHTMERYADVILYMWATEEDFKKKFEASKGVCLKHMKLLCSSVSKSLNASQGAAFLSYLFEKQQSELTRIQDDIHKFTLKFDYRNKDMPWGSAQDAPIRTIEKLTGFIKND
jgi:hypothetical protein